MELLDLQPAALDCLPEGTLYQGEETRASAHEPRTEIRDGEPRLQELLRVFSL